MLQIRPFSSEVQNHISKDLFEHVLWLRNLKLNTSKTDFLICFPLPPPTPTLVILSYQLLLLNPPFNLSPYPIHNHSLQNIFWINLFTSFSTTTVQNKPSFYLQLGKMLQPLIKASGSPDLSLLHISCNSQSDIFKIQTRSCHPTCFKIFNKRSTYLRINFKVLNMAYRALIWLLPISPDSFCILQPSSLPVPTRVF